ncbi:cell wall-binding repeat-containing protein [Bacillus salacetis]|uniref:cell wall-binding repeat-containing protein n=1 Tax=Bacillus salacetis TaxID=2315464 RepID=UPI003B9FD440
MKKIVILLVGLFFLWTSQGTYASANYERVAGDNRIQTAIEVSKKGWPTELVRDESAVILARADNPADALAAASLSGAQDAPILLTATNKIDPAVLDEIKRLNPDLVYLLGGTTAISEEVETSLKDLEYPVQRISGLNRFETAYNINEAAGTSSSEEAILVNGLTVADALSASSESAIHQTPIYLTKNNSMPVELPKTIKKVKIYGGPAAISQDIENQLATNGVEVVRIAGANRYETNLRAIQNLNNSSIIVVRGTSTSVDKEDYPDAVAVSGLAYKLNAPILLSHPTKSRDDLEGLFEWKRFKNVYMIGGPSAISDYVAQQLTNVSPKPMPVIPQKTITLGSTMEDIRDIMPNGRLLSTSTYQYGSSYLYIEETEESWVVTGWDNNGDLKVSVGSKVSNAPDITLGSTKVDVAAAMGTPSYIDPRGNYWSYPSGSRVDFDYQYKVDGFTNEGDLKVKVGIGYETAPPFTVGSTKAEVLSAMGTPDTIEAEYGGSSYWRYGSSRIDFSEDRVESYTNNGELKILLKDPETGASAVSLGSSKSDILRAMGTPDDVVSAVYFRTSWKYGSSYLGVNSQNEVIGWVNNGDLNVTMGEKLPDAEPITVGSTEEAVVQAMGTPDELVDGNWTYDESDILFDNGRARYLDNDSHNLKVSKQEKVDGAPPFTVGSSREDVTRFIGSPDSIREVTEYMTTYICWYYGSSTILFTHDHEVVSWDNYYGDLGDDIPQN